MSEPVYRRHHFVYAGEEVTVAPSPEPDKVWVTFKSGHTSLVKATRVREVLYLVKDE